MNPDFQQIARGLLMCVAFAAASAASAADPSHQAEPQAPATPEVKRSLPAEKKSDAPLLWDRLDPATIARAVSSGAPKAPAFPAERP
jgi:hypothetical protein